MKTKVNIDHLAKLTNVKPTAAFKKVLSDQFSETLRVVDQLNQLDTQNIIPTPQVTGKINQFRNDVIEPSRQLSQKQALKNAPASHEGYFVVDRILE